MEHTIYAKGSETIYYGDLQENTEYIVHFANPLTEGQRMELQSNFGAVLQPIHTQYYLLNYGNFVGETTFCGRTYRVKSRKISWEQFDEMLKSISSMMASLPYQASSPTRLKIQNSKEQERLFYHQWNSLRQALLHEWEGASLVSWWDFINREPHHRLESERVVKPLWLSKQVDHRTIEYVVNHPETWRPLQAGHTLESTSLGKKLTVGGQSYFPVEIQQDQRRISYDTPENRMAKHILLEMHEITLEMNRRLARKSFFNHLHIKKDNLEMQSTLEDLLDTAWLLEVGELHQIPASSTVLQNKNGYRQWYSFYQQSLLGSDYPLPHDDITDMIEGRNIATLFEYWCFFSIARMIGQISGYRPSVFKRESNEDGIHVLRDGLKVTYLIGDERLNVYFNKTFVGKSTGRVGSYTQNYRPDISLHWRSYWYHFDAKFKYTAGLDEDGFTRFVKKEDIDKMHTYKDAIIATRSAWVLFPSDDADSYETYFDPKDISKCSEIGAIGMLPGNMEELSNVIKKLLDTK